MSKLLRYIAHICDTIKTELNWQRLHECMIIIIIIIVFVQWQLMCALLDSAPNYVTASEHAQAHILILATRTLLARKMKLTDLRICLSVFLSMPKK